MGKPKSLLMNDYRQRIKEDPEKRQKYLEKARERQKVNYEKKKAKLNQVEKLEIKEKNRLRQRKCRAKKNFLASEASRSAGLEATSEAYKCRQTLGKAVKKAKNALPVSPRKRKAVLKLIVQNEFENANVLFPRTRKPPVVNEQMIKKVKDFYISDDISRQAPGKKEVRSIKNPVTKKRERIPVRYMLMNITDAHYEFLRRNPDLTISPSSFHELRPGFVLPASETPHNSCVCEKHANFSFFLEAVNAVAEEFPTSTRKLLEEMCCSIENEKCMLEKCRNCKHDLKILILRNEDLNETVEAKQWEKVNGYLVVTKKNYFVRDIIKILNSKLAAFKKHHFTMNLQSVYFSDLKSNLNETQAVVQIDFAENATLTPQNQIQSAYWRQQQATLFTCCIWTKDQENSLAIISDDLRHTKYSIWTFLKVIAEYIHISFPNINWLAIFSDNASSQFRNRFTMSNLCYLKSDLKFQYIEWNTFAPGHGKGSVDGVGAAVKNQVWRKTKALNISLNSPKEYFDAALKFAKKTEIFFVPLSDIEFNEKLLNQRWKNLARQFKSTKKNKTVSISKCHFFRRLSKNQIFMAETSKAKKFKVKVFS